MLKIKKYKLILITKLLFGNAVSCVPNEGIGNEKLSGIGNEKLSGIGNENSYWDLL